MSGINLERALQKVQQYDWADQANSEIATPEHVAVTPPPAPPIAEAIQGEELQAQAQTQVMREAQTEQIPTYEDSERGTVPEPKEKEDGPTPEDTEKPEEPVRNKLLNRRTFGTIGLMAAMGAICSVSANTLRRTAADVTVMDVVTGNTDGIRFGERTVDGAKTVFYEWPREDLDKVFGDDDTEKKGE